MQIFGFCAKAKCKNSVFNIWEMPSDKTQKQESEFFDVLYLVSLQLLNGDKDMTNSNMQIDAAKKTLNDTRWQQVLAKDPKADSQFFYSVKTTGIYCRPSCGARPARPENVDFYLTIEAAEAAGFRACKRCKPNQPSLLEANAAKVAKVCRLIEESETVLSLAKLAEYAELSTFHFHRIFKSITGLTPKEYASAHRSQALRQRLDAKMKVTDAIYEAGYGSNKN